MHQVSSIIVLESFGRRLAIFFLVDVAPLAVLADELHVVYLLFVGLDACAL